MHNHRDSAGDVVVSLDAFKVSRWGASGETVYHVCPLAPWAREMLKDERSYAAAVAAGGQPLRPARQHGDGFLRVEDEPYARGVIFDRRRDALDFVREVELIAREWR